MVSEFTGSNADIIKYSVLGLFGSTISAFCGAGPGAIVGPALIFFGNDPQVAIATGMYAGVLTCGTSSMLLFFFGMIKLDYALLVGIATALGTLPGIYVQFNYVNKSSHQIFIILLCFVFVLIAMESINIP